MKDYEQMWLTMKTVARSIAREYLTELEAARVAEATRGEYIKYKARYEVAKHVLDSMNFIEDHSEKDEIHGEREKTPTPKNINSKEVMLGSVLPLVVPERCSIDRTIIRVSTINDDFEIKDEQDCQKIKENRLLMGCRVLLIKAECDDVIVFVARPGVN